MGERQHNWVARCDRCGEWCTPDYFTCGSTNQDWFPTCFPKTPCGNKQHGAWCARRFTDSAFDRPTA